MNRIIAIMTLLTGAAVAFLVLPSGGSVRQAESVDFRVIVRNIVERSRSFERGDIQSRRDIYTMSPLVYNNIKSIIQSSCAMAEGEQRVRVQKMVGRQNGERARRPSRRKPTSQASRRMPDAGIDRVLKLFAIHPQMAWNERLVFDGKKWRHSRELDEQRSEYLHVIDDLSIITDRNPQRPPSREMSSWNGYVEQVLVGDDVEIRRLPSFDRYPLADHDMSFFDWEAALADDPVTYPFQRIFAEQDGARWRITYANHEGLPEYNRAVYEFSSVLKGAPVSMTQYEGDNMVREVLYGYGSYTNSAGRPFPMVVSDARLEADGTMKVELLVVESWRSECDPADLAIHLPPIRFVVDKTVKGDPIMYLERPEYLKGFAPCEKSSMLLTTILLDIGGEAARSDLNADGVVDMDDLLYALRKYNWN